VVATLINGGITITFTDNALTESGFIVLRSAGFAAWASFMTVGPNPSTGTVTITDLTTAANTPYQYAIAAYNAAGYSTTAYSNIVLTNTAPGAPTNLTATLQNGGLIRLTWRDNATNETGFQVERSLNGGAYAVIATAGPAGGSGTTAVYTDATALASNSYSYRVKAVRLGSSSAYSNVASVTLPALPAAPTGLTALPAATRAVTLTWTDNAMNEAGFSVERSVNGGAFAVLTTMGAHIGTGVMTYNDTTAAAGTAYVYRVRAYNLGGYSAYTNTAAITPAAPTVPGSLSASAIQTSATQTQVTLTWTNPLTETSFNVYRTNSTYTTILGQATLPANQTVYVRNGLARGTTYYYEVRSNNGYGSSAWARVSITTP
jgi:fibronectin type 3 domain-containing protein